MKNDLSISRVASRPPIDQKQTNDDLGASFGGLRPQSAASSLLGRGKAKSIQSLQSKLQDAFANPANRGVLEAAITVERIQKLRGTGK